MNKYKLSFTGKCPNDNATDNYKIIIKSEKMIEVEEILKVVDIAKEKPQYQESIHTIFKINFPDTYIKITGNHLGVEVITKC